jgi:hypothetical protein
MNSGLVALGISILVGMFFLGNIFITPQQKQQLELVSTACNFNIWGLPIGQIGQAISPETAEKCEQVKTAKQILSLQPYIYIGGFVLLVLGLALPSGKKEVMVREVVKGPKEIEEIKIKKEPKPGVRVVKPKIKFCTNCGAKVKGKFCSNCGKKLK